MALRDQAVEAAHARAALETARLPKATELQTTAARYLSRFLGVEVDPLSVVEHELAWPYDPVSTTVDGIEFRGKFKWGGSDERYSHCGLWEATIEPAGRTRWLKRLIPAKTIELTSLADLGDALGTPASTGGEPS